MTCIPGRSVGWPGGDPLPGLCPGTHQPREPEFLRCGAAVPARSRRSAAAI